MTNRELLEKYDCLLLAKGIWLDAEASPELEELLKEFQGESDLKIQDSQKGGVIL